MDNAPFTVSVPVYNIRFQEQGRDALVEDLRALGAKRVFLALQPDCILPPERERELALLKENCAFLHKEGFEVGAWFWTFTLTRDCSFTRMEAPDGKKSKQMHKNIQNQIKFSNYPLQRCVFALFCKVRMTRIV